jgi:transposase
LGTETSILPRGYVCTPCNNEFSKVEDIFLNTLPMSMMQFIVTKVDKVGRFPSVHYQKVHFQKTSPNSIKAVSQAGRSSRIAATKLPNGMFNLKTPDLTSTFSHIDCARTLFKMAIGAIAIEQGRDVALRPRYDPARSFALHGGTFPNWLLVEKNVKPRGSATLEWRQLEPLGTGALADIFGVRFMFGLEPVEPSTPAPESTRAADYLIFDLRRTDKGPHIT